MKKYFNKINTLEELRKQYKELLKIHHPDNGGNVADMQEINAAYDQLFKVLKNRHDSKIESSTKESSLREMLNKIIGFTGVTIEVCGSWIWVFNSYNYRKELKEMGFKFASKKKAWYWHSESFRKRSHNTLSMEDIRCYYGSTEVETDGRKRLKQA